MFEFIVESVLNEISAEDAYNKFYKNIGKDTFDTILNAYGGKFDAIVKFVLNNIRDYKDSSAVRDYALKFIKLYKSCENNVRMEFLKRFKEGKYEDMTDAIQGINEIQNEGVSTVKTRQNEGYIELYNDDRYLLTATLTYEANQHFYGNTKWCTASDRFGRYDGWFYYLMYVFNIEYIREDSVYKNLGTSKYPLKCVLVQFTDKKTNKTYQAQVFGNGIIGQICDEEDTSIEEGNFVNKIIPNELYRYLLRKMHELIEIEENCFRKEYKYQSSRNEYIESKREMIEERNRIRIQQMNEQINQEAERKVDFVQSKFDKIKESELLSNKDFLKQLIVNSANIKKDFYASYEATKEKADHFEEILKSQSYLCVSDVRCFHKFNGIYGILIRTALGHLHRTDFDANGNPIFTDIFNTSCYSAEKKVEGYLMALVEIDKNDNNNYAGIFANVLPDTENVEEIFKGFEIKSILTIENSSKQLGTIYFESMIKSPRNGKLIYNENLFNSFLLVTKQDITEDNGTNTDKEFCSLINVKTYSRINIVTDSPFKYVIPIGDKAFITKFYSNEIILVDLKEMKQEATFISQYIDGSDYCFALTEPETKKLYFLYEKIFDTGLKTKHDEDGLTMVMVSDRFIVFNNDGAKDITEDCKVFDAEEERIIVKHGAFRYGPNTKERRFVHEVFDKDRKVTIQLD